MNILHVINNLDKGGAERLLVEVLPLYKQAGIDVCVLQLSSNKSSPVYVDLLEEAGIKCRSLGHSSLYNPLLIWRLRKYLLANRFDCIHVHLFPAMYFAALAVFGLGSKKARLIFTEHNIQNRRLENWLWRKIDKPIYDQYDKIIAISDDIASKLISSYRLQNKVQVIRNGINIEKIETVLPLQRTKILQDLQIPSSAKLLFMAARFNYPKDHITPIEALALLPLSFHLIYAGEGRNLPSIRSYAEKKGLAGRVHLIGFRNDVLGWMKAADINILSSAFEGMSGATLEGLASGGAFLGANVSGINNVVPDERFLFKEKSAQDLANHIEKIIGDPEYRNDMLTDSRIYIKKFDIQHMVTEHLNLYKNLLNESGKG